MATTDFSVKVNCNGENRRFTVLYKSTLEEFKKQCRTVFRVLQGVDFLVKYYDDEDDLITCEQEDEWVEAKRLTTRKNNLLKVSLLPGQELDSSSASTTFNNSTSDIATDVKSALSHIYKETETVTEELVSEAVKLLSSLVLVKKPEEKPSSQSSVEVPAEEFVLDASRDTLELRPKQPVQQQHASIEQQIQEEQQPKKDVPNPMEQSWTFIEVKEENHDDEEDIFAEKLQPTVAKSAVFEEELPVEEPVKPIEEPAKQVEEQTQPPILEPPKELEPPKFEQPKLDCQFIADVTMPDGIKVETKQTVTKTWLIRNSGNVQWPIGTMMCYLSGPLHTVIELQFVHDVPRLYPNETTEVTIQFKTSDKILGKQKGTFCLSDQFGKLFGQKFFFDIEVVEPKLAVKPVVPAPAPIQAPIPAPIQVPIPAPIQVPVPQPAPMPAPIHVPIPQPSKFASELEVLQSMGFNDTKKNVDLLEKHKGDLNLVIETLLR